MRIPTAILVISSWSFFGVGCGDDGSATADAMTSPDSAVIDAALDATPDAMSACPGMLEFTGEYVDWDSTPEMFVGVFDAELAEVGNPGNTDRTAPNGRGALCLPAGVDSFVSFTQPDYLRIHYTADDAATPLGAFFLKGLSLARVDGVFSELQVVRDPAAAQVLIAVNSGVDAALTAEVALPGATTAGGFTDRGDGTYEAGTTLGSDRFVLFANVDAAAGTVAVNVTPPAGQTCVGPSEIEVIAGQIAATNFFCTP